MIIIIVAGIIISIIWMALAIFGALTKRSFFQSPASATNSLKKAFLLFCALLAALALVLGYITHQG